MIEIRNSSVKKSSCLPFVLNLFVAFVVGNPELLLADRQDLRRYHLMTKTYTRLINNQEVQGAIAMDYHFASSYVYWTDVTNKEIKRSVVCDAVDVCDVLFNVNNIQICVIWMKSTKIKLQHLSLFLL